MFRYAEFEWHTARGQLAIRTHSVHACAFAGGQSPPYVRSPNGSRLLVATSGRKRTVIPPLGSSRSSLASLNFQSLSPADIFLNLSSIRILIALQPKPKPIYVALL